MLVNLNGWPGAGKLTDGRHLARLIGARLIINHAIIDLAEAIADRYTTQFYEAVRSIRTATFNQLVLLPNTTPIVLTNVIVRGGSGFPEETWRAIINLARVRRCELYAVTLACDQSELARRIALEDRASFQKVRDAAFLETVMAERPLFDDGATDRLTIDNTQLPPEVCAVQIASWLTQRGL